MTVHYYTKNFISDAVGVIAALAGELQYAPGVENLPQDVLNAYNDIYSIYNTLRYYAPSSDHLATIGEKDPALLAALTRIIRDSDTFVPSPEEGGTQYLILSERPTSYQDFLDKIEVVGQNATASARTSVTFSTRYTSYMRYADFAADMKARYPHLIFHNLGNRRIFQSIGYDGRVRAHVTLNPDFFSQAEMRFANHISLDFQDRMGYSIRPEPGMVKVVNGRTAPMAAIDDEQEEFFRGEPQAADIYSIRAALARERAAYRRSVMSRLQRANVLDERRAAAEERERRLESEQRFDNFRKKSVQRSSEVVLPSLPMVESGKGIKASRRWGIEIETGAGRDLTAVPDQWDSKGDGSLESAYSGYKTEYREPADCYWSMRHSLDEEDSRYRDPEECGECGEVEFYDEDGDEDDCIELVSPILTSVHSRGLRSITNDLEFAPRTDSAGVHVHVEAKDLTVRQLRELVLAYDHIEDIIESSYDRVERGYCKRRSTSELMDVVRSAKGAKHHRDMQKGDRYVTLNLHALTQHGTVEFRAMGPKYNYDYLIRWAMFCREMVNTVANGATAREWNKVKDWAGVLKMFRQYGAELVLAEGAPMDASELSPEGELAAV